MSELSLWQGIVVMWWFHTNLIKYNRFAILVKTGMNIDQAFKIVKYDL